MMSILFWPRHTILPATHYRASCRLHSNFTFGFCRVPWADSLSQAPQLSEYTGVQVTIGSFPSRVLKFIWQRTYLVCDHVMTRRRFVRQTILLMIPSLSLAICSTAAQKNCSLMIVGARNPCMDSSKQLLISSVLAVRDPRLGDHHRYDAFTPSSVLLRLIRETRSFVSHCGFWFTNDNECLANKRCNMCAITPTLFTILHKTPNLMKTGCFFLPKMTPPASWQTMQNPRPRSLWVEISTRKKCHN